MRNFKVGVVSCAVNPGLCVGCVTSYNKTNEMH